MQVSVYRCSYTGVCVQVFVYRFMCTGVCIQVYVYRCLYAGVCMLAKSVVSKDIWKGKLFS